MTSGLCAGRSRHNGLGAGSRSYVQQPVRPLGVTPQQLRIDRLASEAQANNGDVLRLSLFGLSTPGAMRHCGEMTGPGETNQ